MSASPLAPYVELRTALVGERLGDGGADVCAALTETLDQGIAELASDLPPGIAIVAVGGYGRREQCIFSDVDLLVVHGRGDAERAVRDVLYPLWDANLKVGHAVRTPSECATAGKEDFATLTALLSSRVIGGDAALGDELIDVVVGLVRGRPLAPHLASLERDRRLSTPYQVMTADVKEGRGGLRTHQGVWWERRRAELLGLPVDDPHPAEAGAFRDLLSVRNALHAAARRANDRFVVGLREPAARWLDIDVAALAARLTGALAAGDRIADRRWPDIHVETDPMVKFGRRIFHAVRSRFSPEEEAATEGSGIFPMAVNAAGRADGARFTLEEEDTIRTAPATWTAGDRAAFVQLLTAGSRGMAIFGQLDELGWLDRVFPEWRGVATAPQLAPFHDHPVGAHLHRAVAEMLALIDDRGEVGEVAGDVGANEELILTAFLHDIGKARGGDHSEIGADLAMLFLHRAGFGPATVAGVSDAVRLHLLLPETATRRDIADAAVLDEVAVLAGSARQLRILYLLAIADLRATGTAVWNPWRASLLRTLYQRVLAAIEADGAVPATPDVEAVVLASDGSFGRRAIEEHVAAMPDTYLDTTTSSDVLWHLGAAAALGERTASVSADPADPGRVLVAGTDRIGFLLAVSRAFAANGVGVRDARLRTRSDGIALDTFHVVDDRTGEAVPADRFARVERDLIGMLEDERDVRPRVRERADAYRKPEPQSAVDVRVRLDGRYAAVEVRMPDGVGVFTAIVEALHGEGLDIHLARIDTMGDEARDVFHVRRIGGTALRTEPELRALEKRLLDRLRA